MKFKAIATSTFKRATVATDGKHRVIGSHSILIVQKDRGEMVIERFDDMPEGVWAEIAVDRIIPAQRKRTGKR